MAAFLIIWIGQVVSLLGTAMTGFALTIWAWLITGEATVLALMGFFQVGPILLVSPFAGVLVDRWNRRLTMMLSDLAAVLSTMAVLLLFMTNNLQIWHLYVTGAFTGAFQAFQFPAYSAAISMMLPKKQYTRASAMLSMAQTASGIFAPVLAAILLGIIDIAAILIIDVITFMVAIATLLLIHIPHPTVTEAGRKGKGSIWKESAYGFHYIFERPSLLGLQLIFFAINLLITFSGTVQAPMILARTGNDKIMLGSVQSAGAIGGLVGGLLLSIWGGPKRKVHGVLIGMALSSLLGRLLMGFGRDPYVWALAAFFALFFIPIINGSNQAIWQAKVAPDVQGRVFAVRQLIAWATVPVANLLAGPLADHIFEPAMMPDGGLATMFGGAVGTGPGAGMSLMFIIAGILGILVSLGGYAFHIVRNAEDILPDHDAEITLSPKVH
ncbi:MAG: MFS transporter [Promethearchaeota archaeon]